MKTFQDRFSAGQALAQKLESYAAKQPLILALPRGGLPIGLAIARALNAPMNVFGVKKISSPTNREFAVGAIAEDGTLDLDEATIEKYGWSRGKIGDSVRKKSVEIQEQMKVYREILPTPDVHGKTVIVADDGLATGATMEAAVRVLRQRGAARIVVACPVASANAFEKLQEKADDIVCLIVARDFVSVSDWYENFKQVTTQEALAYLKEARPMSRLQIEIQEVVLHEGESKLVGDLRVPPNPKAVVIFAHGSGSSRKSPRNIAVAEALNRTGFATLLLDLLTARENRVRDNVFNIELLSGRLLAATTWVRNRFAQLPIAYFGASTGAAAAIHAAAQKPEGLYAVVSRGGRTDLALTTLSEVRIPVLLLVGSKDLPVIPLNRMALTHLYRGRLELIPGATHLFTEPGKLEMVIERSLEWLHEFLPTRSSNEKDLSLDVKFQKFT